jgi:hypothetical protein
MPTDSTVPDDALRRSLQELSALRRFSGMPAEFWSQFQAYIGAVTGAQRVVVLVQNKEQKWGRIGEWSSGGGITRSVLSFTQQIETLAEHCARTGEVFAPADRSNGNGPAAVAVRLKLHNPEDVCVAAILLPGGGEAAAREALVRLHLASDVPQAYQTAQAIEKARSDGEQIAAALDLSAMINAETRFLGAAMAFCNGLATRFNCDRVSLGWLQNGIIQLQAISRTETFSRQMEAAQKLECAMEEALDQDDEVVWPAAADSPVVARDHEIFARHQRIDHLASLPLRIGDKVVAVVTCERQAALFSAEELQQMRLCCDQVARRVSDLKTRDRWFGARAATALRDQVEKLLGPEHTWAKVFAVLGVIALALLFFLPVSYRLEGNFVLRSDDVSYLTGPFDGFINEVLVRPGDVVTKGDKLAALDTSELLLEEAGALADMNRYLREAEKARAAGALADMRISQALADQAKARLEATRYRLARAVVRSPFDGVVVEGDLRERLGAPVKQGDALFKVARLETLYVEAEINERDVHDLVGRTTGEIAFVTQPRLKYPVRVTRVEPAAAPGKEGNYFLVRCALDGTPQPWWRPGMSGVCKLNVEKRSLLWIITHRTVDFLRLKLWW